VADYVSDLDTEGCLDLDRPEPLRTEPVFAHQVCLGQLAKLFLEF